MSVPEILKTIADGFQSGATVKNVYGEPISKGDTIVIPVARLSYAFGGGGGREAEGATEKDGGGGGGGGHMSAEPSGVVEITSAGTRFVPFRSWGKIASVVGVSLAVGFAIGMQRGRQKLEKTRSTESPDS